MVALTGFEPEGWQFSSVQLAETPPAAIATVLPPAVWKNASLPVVHAPGAVVPGLEVVAQKALVPHVPLPVVKPFAFEMSQ